MSKNLKVKIVYIAVENLSVIWTKAQRRIDEKRVKKIANNLDPDLFGVIYVTEPNGKNIYHVIDGQHRVEAIRLIWGNDEKIPCAVLPVEDPKRAAQIFDGMNTGRKSPSSIDKFKVRLEAGYETEIAVHKILRDLGYTVSTSGSPGTIRAIDACVGTYKRFGADGFRNALMVIQAIWGKDDTDSVEAAIIRGMAMFLYKRGNAINKHRFIKQIAKKFAADRLLAAAKWTRARRGASMPESVAAELIHTYNRGLRKGRIEESKEAA